MCIRDSLETVERLKRQGFTDKTMQDWTFANDNGSCPQMKNAAGYVARWEPVSYTHLDVYKRQMMTGINVRHVMYIITNNV